MPIISSIDLSTLDGTNGFRLDGFQGGDRSGISVSSAGDINADGYLDLIIGAYLSGISADTAGVSYVVLGASGGFASSLDLSALDGTNGFRLDGIDAFDYSGQSVSGGGDINGDGYADLLIGARGGDEVGNRSGESYIVFGTSGGFASSLDLSSLDGSSGFRLDGVGSGDQSGVSVSHAGDVNGDGYDDVIIGARFGDASGIDSGESYVVFGASGGFASSLDLSSLDGSNGFRLDGVDAGDQSGWAVSDAGDVNGDGYADVLVGVYLSDANGVGSGESYVVFGASGGFASSLDLSSLDGSNGFRLDGIDADDRSGWSLGSAGDVNGDGYSDLIIGARRGDAGGQQSGESYVVFGASGGFASSLDLSSLDGTNGFRLDGNGADHRSAWSVSGAGDVNGDGYDDVIVGARGGIAAGSLAGESFVVFGASGGFASSLDLSALDGTNGFRLDGIDPSDGAGRSVSGAGDVNGDGSMAMASTTSSSGHRTPTPE